MNNTFKNLLSSSITCLYNTRKHTEPPKELYYVCKFNELGFRFNDEHKIGLNDMSVRDNIINTLMSNKNIIDKKLYDIMFNKDVIVNKDDYSYYRVIVFALIFKLSKKSNWYLDGDEFYVY